MFSGQHVLVVDDNDITASIEEQILTERGLVVDRAINGEDAICMFERSPAHYYDLILMDIEMETMNAGILYGIAVYGWLCNNNGDTTASRGWKDGSSDCVVFPVICRR